MNCVIIEDEPQAVNTLKFMLKDYFPDIKVINEFDKVSEAMNYIKSNPVQFVFLDVQLNGELGLDIIKYIDKDDLNFDIIFTTAYSDYALQAFSIAAIDYLLKPINPDRFKEAVNRAIKNQKINIEQIALINQVSEKQKFDRLILKNNDGLHTAYLNEIIYLKAANSYTEFFLNTGKRIVVSKSIKEYEALTELDYFFKTHRSFIVNTNFISTYHKGNLILTLNDGVEVPLSREKKKDFEDFFLK